MIERTVTRSPPTFATMSAKTVVVVTTCERVVGSGRRRDPERTRRPRPSTPAGRRARTARCRPAADIESQPGGGMGSVIAGQSVGRGQAVRRIGVGAAAWQAGHSPNSSRRCSSTRNPVRRAISRTTVRRPGVGDLGGPPAARADDVVVVGRRARRRRRARRSAGRAARRRRARTGPRASGRSSPGRSRGGGARASRTRSAAVKWPTWSAMSSATARRGVVRRYPARSRATRSGSGSPMRATIARYRD